VDNNYSITIAPTGQASDASTAASSKSLGTFSPRTFSATPAATNAKI